MKNLIIIRRCGALPQATQSNMEQGLNGLRRPLFLYLFVFYSIFKL